jgi:hypothetical protein
LPVKEYYKFSIDLKNRLCETLAFPLRR